MSGIQIQDSELYSKRRTQITRMLRPLKTERPLYCARVPYRKPGAIALVARDIESEKPTHRDYPFRLKDSQVDCHYFEIWRVSERERMCTLYHAHLIVCKVIRRERVSQELLCIHCDPMDTSDEPAGSYKRGPHLHVVMAEAPLPRCHFPLCLTDLDSVLDSPESLTRAMQHIVGVIQHEVVDRYRT